MVRYPSLILALCLLPACATRGDLPGDPVPVSDTGEQKKAVTPTEVPATPTEVPATPTPTPKSSFWLSAVGDIMMGTTFPHETGYLPPEGPGPLMQPVEEHLIGSVVFGNLEGPLIDGGITKKCGPGQNCYAFRSPTSYVDVLKDAGFTVVSIANNHALDFGEEGRESTIATLDQAGILYSGPIGQVALFEAGNQEVALVAFTTSGHSNDFRDIEEAKNIVEKLSLDHDVVIVSFHGGMEGSKALHISGKDEFLGNEKRGNPINFAHAVIDAGADLVLGHGPHVLRAMEVYNDRFITYSLGNFFTYGRFNLRGVSGQAAVLQVEIAPDGHFIGGKIVPTIQVKPGGPYVDPEGGAIPLLQRLTREDIDSPGLIIDDDGLLSPIH